MIHGELHNLKHKLNMKYGAITPTWCCCQQNVKVAPYLLNFTNLS